MAISISIVFTFISLSILSIASAYGPTCRSKNIFPHVSCEPQCAPYSYNTQVKCRKNEQFGCSYERCSGMNFQCSLNQTTENNNPCPNGEVPVENVSLQHYHPVEVNLAINLRGYPLHVLLLIDASAPSSQINALKPEMVSLLRKLEGTAEVSVAIYGAEQEFDSSGYSVLAAKSDDVTQAIQALDGIPQKADGARTTLTALRSLVHNGILRASKDVVLLIGDTPGREPECGVGFDRIQTANELYSVHTGAVLLPVSIGTPGLDGALPAPEACPNSYIETKPIDENQASYIASHTQGEVIETVTADEMLQAIDRARRKDGRIHQRPPGSYISVSTARFPNIVGPFTVPEQFQTYSNGCEERVIATLTGVSGFVSAPAQTNAKLKLDLPLTACLEGPFSCEVRIVERQQGYEAMSVWYRPLVIYEIITVSAC
eukprot:gb/GEZJ01004888.1/.p1 GENE.gb/GEZJ01004888.1/~~gb/GEZJ01004888.1/.p1  ORF type:complete len:491 (-),score=41.49 gb/GEZJ01004888.1/:110-1402(-)